MPAVLTYNLQLREVIHVMHENDVSTGHATTTFQEPFGPKSDLLWTTGPIAIRLSLWVSQRT